MWSWGGLKLQTAMGRTDRAFASGLARAGSKSRVTYRIYIANHVFNFESVCPVVVYRVGLKFF